MYLYSRNEFTWGYTIFSWIRAVIRVFACLLDCSMMDTAVAAIDPTNGTLLHFKVETLIKCTVGCCVLCWVSKLFVLLTFESCGHEDNETCSDFLSLITLWIGEIPKTGFHLFIVCKHSKAVYRNLSRGQSDSFVIFGLLSIYKFVERLWGIEKKYDWRTNKWSDVYNNLYIWGIIIETGISLLSIALAYFGA